MTDQQRGFPLGPYGTGEIGHEAFRFIDWLSSCGCQCWQVLPLVPPDQMFYSPYTGLDANCGNPLLVSLDSLIQEGLLNSDEAPEHLSLGHSMFPEAVQKKYPLLSLAAQRLLGEDRFQYLRDELAKFRSENPWVEDSALFEVLRSTPELNHKVWWEWPEPIRFHEKEAIQNAKNQHKQAIDEFIAIQLLFHRQWIALKHYANSKGIKIVGDMPIYVGGHSADVWANQSLFELSETGCPALVSGVPPDAFSETGQLWGTPLYDWKVASKPFLLFESLFRIIIKKDTLGGLNDLVELLLYSMRPESIISEALLGTMQWSQVWTQQ